MSANPRQDFIDSEKAYILNLIIQHDINNKPKKEKYAAWVSLAEDYNAIPSNSKRTVEQLRKFWFNFQHQQQDLMEPHRPSKMRRYTILYDSDPQAGGSTENIDKEEVLEFNDEINNLESVDQDTQDSSQMREEFALLQENYRLTWEKEDELHKQKVIEMEYLLQAAEEAHKIAVVKKDAANEELQCVRAKRKLAEYELDCYRTKYCSDS